MRVEANDERAEEYSAALKEEYHRQTPGQGKTSKNGDVQTNGKVFDNSAKW